VFAFALASLLSIAPAAARPAASPPAPGQSNQIIIALRPSADRATRDSMQRPAQLGALSARAGVQLSYARAMSGDAHVLRLPETVPDAQARAIAARLSASPDVLFAEPDYINVPFGGPNDPLYSQQWDFGAPSSGGANIEAAWEYTTGDPNLTIAVIDTGIRPDHPDLAGRLVSGLGYDFIGDLSVANDGNGRDADPSDPGDWTDFGECGGFGNSSSWHGTHVAGTIAAATNNGVGVAGINRQSKILSLRTLGKCGGYVSDIADAVRWAAGISVAGVPANAHPARVINMSLGGTAACPQSYQNAINDAVARGTVVVVAAGNENMPASNATPANCDNVIAVGATSRQGQLANYSNYGPEVDLSAPGGEQSFENDPNGVLSTLNSGTSTPSTSTYGYYQGTSMAAPHVAGVASLMLSLVPTLTPAEIESLLKSNVTSFPSGCSQGSGNCGTGILNAAKVIAAIQSPPIFSSAQPPLGVLKLPYAFQFVATGAPKPKYEVTSGQLPPGLSLSAGGLLSGVPTDVGSWQFTVRASNGVGSPDAQALEFTVEERELFYLPVIAAFS
jgi:serine protease